MTSNDVDSKYLLRSDQKVLDQQGRINLKELGLIPEDRQTDQNTGQMVLTAGKNISARLRKEEATPISKPDSINQSILEVRGGYRSRSTALLGQLPGCPVSPFTKIVQAGAPHYVT